MESIKNMEKIRQKLIEILDFMFKDDSDIDVVFDYCYMEDETQEKESAYNMSKRKGDN